MMAITGWQLITIGLEMDDIMGCIYGSVGTFLARVFAAAPAAEFDVLAVDDVEKFLDDSYFLVDQLVIAIFVLLLMLMLLFCLLCVCVRVQQKWKKGFSQNLQLLSVYIDLYSSIFIYLSIYKLIWKELMLAGN